MASEALLWALLGPLRALAISDGPVDQWVLIRDLSGHHIYGKAVVSSGLVFGDSQAWMR